MCLTKVSEKRESSSQCVRKEHLKKIQREAKEGKVAAKVLVAKARCVLDRIPPYRMKPQKV